MQNATSDKSTSTGVITEQSLTVERPVQTDTIKCNSVSVQARVTTAADGGALQASGTANVCTVRHPGTSGHHLDMTEPRMCLYVCQAHR